MSDFLFARPSFIEGVARNIDLFGTLQTYNVSLTGEEADAKALGNDFRVVGDDLRAAIGKYGEEKKLK